MAHKQRGARVKNARQFNVAHKKDICNICEGMRKREPGVPHMRTGGKAFAACVEKIARFFKTR